MKKILAFTMAEILVVMGIIGVVAAITIPTLNNASNEKETVAKVSKAASDITDAYGRARAKYGRYGSAITNQGKRIFSFMNTKNCRYDNATVKNLVDSNTVSYNYAYFCELGDGMDVSFDVRFMSPPSGAASAAVVDVDGIGNGYDTIGIDVFMFLLSSDGGLDTSDSGLSSPKNKWWKYANHILETGRAEYLDK